MTGAEKNLEQNKNAIPKYAIIFNLDVHTSFWEFLEIGDPQVTKGFNTKSWSSMTWMISGVQWNHCLTTYCNKNFRVWIAGFNPFCQLIEKKRTLGYSGILATGCHWFLCSFNGYQYTKHSCIHSWYTIARSKHARSKRAASATGIRTPIRLASMKTTACTRR